MFLQLFVQLPSSVVCMIKVRTVTETEHMVLLSILIGNKRLKQNKIHAITFKQTLL